MTFIISSVPVHAQRTAEGSLFAEASLGVTLCPRMSSPSGAVDVSLGGYLAKSLWKVGLKGADYLYPLYDRAAWRVSGGWEYRVFGTYDRSLGLYLGAQAFLGFDTYQTFRAIPEGYTSSLPSISFIYGAEPFLEFEYYPLPRTALLVGVQCPLTLGSIPQNSWVGLTVSVGVRHGFKF